MVFDPSLANVLNVLGGLLFVILGLYAVRVGPEEAKNRAFGLFAVLFGSNFALFNTSAMWDPPLLGARTPWLRGPLTVGVAIAALWLAYALVDRMTDEPRGPLARAAAVGLGVFVAQTLVLTVYRGEVLESISGGLVQLWSPAGVHVLTASFSAMVASLFVVLYAVVSAYGPDVASRLRTEVRIVTVALATYLGFIVGAGWSGQVGVSTGLDHLAWLTAIGFAATVGLAALWLKRSRQVPGSGRARDVALYLLAVPLVGLVVQTPTVPHIPGAYGITRTVAVLVLAYGILKHDVMGIDRKVEWTVSKTTVAGIFVAVFFIVSEGAQVLFADFAQNEILGVIAAGALLFALSPIQRAADRIAEEVVPSGGPSDASEAERRYRDVVEAALADGEITDADERHLAEKAEELGLSPKRVYEIRSDVEDGTDGGDPS